MAFLTQEQVAQKGFQFVGKEVKIFENAVFSNCLKISINDYSRIDDFCLISAK